VKQARLEYRPDDTPSLRVHTPSRTPRFDYFKEVAEALPRLAAEAGPFDCDTALALVREAWPLSPRRHAYLASALTTPA